MRQNNSQIKTRIFWKWETVWLWNVFPTLFIYVRTGIIENRSFASLNLIDKSASNGQEKVLHFATFHDHCWGHYVVYPSWPHILITKLFQASHNCRCTDSWGTKRYILMPNKDFGPRSPPLLPQLLVTCIFTKICLVRRWPCIPTP